MYAVRQLPPVQEVMQAATDKVAGVFTRGFEGAGRSEIEVENGVTGGTSMLAVGAGGFAGMVKRIGNIQNIFKVGPHTVGDYADVGVHHPHQQAARSNNPNYNPRTALSVADDGTFNHDAISAAQRRLNADFARTNKTYTLEIEENIQRQAMIKGDMKPDHVDRILELSRERLKPQNSLDPTRIPGTRRGK